MVNIERKRWQDFPFNIFFMLFIVESFLVIFLTYIYFIYTGEKFFKETKFFISVFVSISFLVSLLVSLFLFVWKKNVQSTIKDNACSPRKNLTYQKKPTTNNEQKVTLELLNEIKSEPETISVKLIAENIKEKDFWSENKNKNLKVKNAIPLNLKDKE